MPALEAFGRKWKVGSDDFVFPYLGSILVRFLWFIIIGVVVLTYDKQYSCDDERLLKVYLYVLVVMHFCMCLIELSVVFISAQGTIANSEPRKRLSIALYVQTVFFILELAWDIVGVLWAFDSTIDCDDSHSVLILARAILIWNLVSSAVIGSYMVLRIGICRLLCRKTPKKLRYEQLVPSTSFGGRRLSAMSSGGLAQHRRQRHWQWRIQWLCCCMRLQEHQQDLFSEVSATLADAFTYFRGYVPSDILAGMALLAMEQSASKDTNWDDTNESPRRKLLDFNSKAVSKHFNRVVRYMKFSAGAYGWSFNIYEKGSIGFCKLLLGGRCCDKCRKKPDVEEGEEAGFVVQEDSCGWHMRTLKSVTGLQETDIVYASFESEIFCPGFYVAYDHKEQAVLLVIRGIATIRDILTDLSAEPGILSTSDSGDFYAHKGIMHSAHAVQLKLESEGILEKAFEDYPDYRLVVIGHSLGAGVASVLAILLKPKYSKLHCYAYSPPGCILSMSAVPHTRPFITTITVGNDLMARLSLQNFETFSERVLHCIQTCNLPKCRIFMDSFLYWLGICRPLLKKNRKLSVTEMAIQREPLLNTDYEANYDEEDIYDVIPDMKEVQKTDAVTGKEKHHPRARMPLFLPGRIIHISWGPKQSRCCGLWKHQPLQAHWTAQSEFSELVLEKNMFKNHTPDTVLKMLRCLQKQENLLAVHGLAASDDGN